MGILRDLLKGFGDALFVNFKCMFCNTETTNTSLICDKCASSVKRICDTICPRCGANAEKSSGMCLYCFDKDYKFSEHRSCFVYNEQSSRPIKLLKYEQKKYLADPIARVMFALNSELFDGVDYLTFVPMTKERMKARGYNHGEELAKSLAEISGVPVISMIKKTKSTEHQADLNFVARCENLKGSFELEENVGKLIKGKSVVIVDDVFTTGSTISECSRILRKCKLKSIKAITFLKTDPFENVNV